MKENELELTPIDYSKQHKLYEIFVPKKKKSKEQIFFSNVFKKPIVLKTVSKPILAVSKVDSQCVFSN